jgi:hypothetical protein
MKLILDIFKNPIVGLLGSVASIISLILAVYFYIAAAEKKELTYYVHPAKTSVVNIQDVGKFEVLFDGKPIEKNVSIARVAFWNAGRKPIIKNDILKKLEIETNSGPILETRIEKISRDVINLEIDKSNYNQNKIQIAWDVLEENDGACIQIVYVGDTNAFITAKSTIVGQGEIKHLEFGDKIKTPTEQYDQNRSRNKLLGFLLLGAGFVFVCLQIYFVWDWKKSFGEYDNLFKKSSIFSYIQILFFWGLSIYYLFFNKTYFTPFGF